MNRELDQRQLTSRRLWRYAAGLCLLVAMNAGPAWPQKPARKPAPSPDIPAKAMVSRIGPIYGPDKDKNGKDITINVVTDFTSPSHDTPAPLNLDEVRDSATLVCSDCESSKAVRPTEARHFSDIDEGITLVIVVETGEELGPLLASIKHGLNGIYGDKHSKDRVALVTVGGDIHTIADFSSNDQFLQNAVKAFRTEPGVQYPRLYRGITKALDLFDQADKSFPQRRRMLIVSTGRNAASAQEGGFRDDDIIARANQVNVVIDAIGIPIPLPPQNIPILPSNSGIAQNDIPVLQIPPNQTPNSFVDALEKVARATGGLFQRHDPGRPPDIGLRMQAGVKWVRETPVLTFNLKDAIPSDEKEHQFGVRFSSQPGREFSSKVLMPPSPNLFKRYLVLIIFVAAILVLLALVLFKGTAKPKHAESITAAPDSPSQPLRTPEASGSRSEQPEWGGRTMQEGFGGAGAGGSRLNVPESGFGGGAQAGIGARPPATPPGRSSTRVLNSLFPQPGNGTACCSLRVVAGARAGTAFPMNFSELTIGREQEMNTIALPDPGISSHHATLRWSSGMLTITDDSSTNGTRVGTIALAASRPHPLQPGDQIQMGSTTLVVEMPRSAGRA